MHSLPEICLVIHLYPYPSARKRKDLVKMEDVLTQCSVVMDADVILCVIGSGDY